MNIRRKFIQFVIGVNENIFFYPKLKKFYSLHFKNKPITLIDVGVNRGQSIDFFSKIGSSITVFGFEPNKNLYKKLLRKYASKPNIQLINKGISAQKGMLTFHENVMDETSTFEQLNYSSDYLQKKAKVLGVKPEDIIVGSYDVAVETLYNFLQEQNTFFDVLKIDIEGHELSALQGLFNKSDAKIQYPIKFIQLESHNDTMYLNTQDNKTTIDNLLTKNGFKLVKEIKHGFGDFSEIIYKNTRL
ncbi:FkbM family methyltransferase [Flavobacterium litorale]|uniref:FkbM family methyltransferase n=1 Tax=Flavobacterium litorale TaxID=2856519 RepID=A0ABX8V885_9FLAO|nr:FkbM family methyltransferase [Flavobacterium litorale]QYJ69060.1 FkbM family methyltransferase [Flavobacterium litorale]